MTSATIAAMAIKHRPRIGLRSALVALIVASVVPFGLLLHFTWWRTATKVSRDLVDTLERQITNSVRRTWWGRVLEVQGLSQVVSEAAAVPGGPLSVQVGDELAVDAHPLGGHVLLDAGLGQPCRGESVEHGRRGGLVVGHPAIVHPGTDSSGRIGAARHGERAPHAWRRTLTSCRSARLTRSTRRAHEQRGPDSRKRSTPKKPRLTGLAPSGMTAPYALLGRHLLHPDAPHSGSRLQIVGLA